MLYAGLKGESRHPVPSEVLPTPHYNPDSGVSRLPGDVKKLPAKNMPRQKPRLLPVWMRSAFVWWYGHSGWEGSLGGVHVA